MCQILPKWAFNCISIAWHWSPLISIGHHIRCVYCLPCNNYSEQNVVKYIVYQIKKTINERLCNSYEYNVIYNIDIWMLLIPNTHMSDILYNIDTWKGVFGTQLEILSWNSYFPLWFRFCTTTEAWSTCQVWITYSN